MTIAPATAKIVIREAHKEFSRIQSIIEDYNDMAEDCYRHGFRPQYCIHGSNQWTDYDNICGPCEDGYDPRKISYMDTLKETLEDYRKTQAKVKANSDHFLQITSSFCQLGLPEMGTKAVLDALDQLLGRFAK